MEVCVREGEVDVRWEGEVKREGTKIGGEVWTTLTGKQEGKGTRVERDCAQKSEVDAKNNEERVHVAKQEDKAGSESGRGSTSDTGGGFPSRRPKKKDKARK